MGGQRCRLARSDSLTSDWMVAPVSAIIPHMRGEEACALNVGFPCMEENDLGVKLITSLSLRIGE